MSRPHISYDDDAYYDNTVVGWTAHWLSSPLKNESDLAIYLGYRFHLIEPEDDASSPEEISDAAPRGRLPRTRRP